MQQLFSSFLVFAVCAVTGQSVTDQFQITTDKNSNFSTADPPFTSDNTASSNSFTTAESNTYSSVSTDSKGGDSTTQDEVFKAAGSTESTTMSAPLTPPPPTPPPGRTSPAPRTSHKSTTVSPNVAGSDKTGIIILIILILLTFVLGAGCFFARERRRRDSVDLTSRPDEVTVPLSAVEVELPAESDPEKDLQTFQGTENPAKEIEVKPEAQETQKEADKPVADPSATSASSSDDKPKQDVVEDSSPAPVEVMAEEKTDDEAVASNKTSVESLKETNENSSNDVGLCHRGE